MPDVILSEVEEFAGSNDKGPWVKYTLKDTGGQPVAATFSAELGNVAKGLIGNLVTIQTKPASNPKYAPTLVSVEAAANGSFTPPPEPHHKPVLAGDKDRAITRQACLKAAAPVVAALASHQNLDPAIELMRVAGQLETWVYRDIDDVPFD